MGVRKDEVQEQMDSITSQLEESDGSFIRHMRQKMDRMLDELLNANQVGEQEKARKRILTYHLHYVGVAHVRR